jgi:hypothetical protein
MQLVLGSIRCRDSVCEQGREQNFVFLLDHYFIRICIRRGHHNFTGHPKAEVIKQHACWQVFYK